MWLRVLGLASLVALTGCSGAPAGDTGTEKVTVYRDQFFTPHIVAETNRGVFYGYGYAVATDRLFQMEMLRRTTQGSVAQVLGGEYLALDTRIRTGYDHRSVRQQLQALSPEDLEILQGYADGFSARVKEVLAQPGELLPLEFSEYDFLPQAWDAYDVAMLFAGSIAHRYSDFNSERDNLALLQSLEKQHGKDKAWKIFSASKWLLDNNSPTTVPGGIASSRQAMPSRPDYLDELIGTSEVTRITLDESGRFAGLTNEAGNAEAQKRRMTEQGFSYHPEFSAASNYWSARNLEDAPAALVNGPQFGFSSPGYVYGIGLHGGDFHTVGNTLLAMPALLFAHNNHIAWGSTAGMSDQSDEFALQLHPDDSELYRHGDDWLKLESWHEVIEVKGSEAITVTARRSVQGMVLSWQPEQQQAWVRARSWEGHELASMMAWVWLPVDRDLDAAHKRIGTMATNINMYTMDRAGNLGYVHSGRYPQRAAGHDSRLPVPGDGALDWQGLRPYGDNPTVRNPAQDYIANWNNRPRADWVSSDLWTYTWSRADRGQILFDALEKRRGGTVEGIDSINREISTADVNAPFLLPYLYAAWEGQAPSRKVRAALEGLRAWDRQWQVDQNGNYGMPATVMEAWLRTLLEQTLQDDVGDEWFHLYAATNYPHKPLGASLSNAPGIKALVRNLDHLASGTAPDYDFFNGKPSAIVLRGSFVSALESLAEEQGDDLSQWVLAAHPMQWQPYNFRGVPQASESRVLSLPGYMNRGSENNLFVATGKGIEARDVVPPGQSGFVNGAGQASPHAADQMPLYTDFDYKPVPFTAKEVKAAAVSEVTLQLPR